MQRLTAPKMLEIEKLIEKDLVIICLPETQLILNEVPISENINKYDSVRKSTEQKKERGDSLLGLRTQDILKQYKRKL